MEQLLCREDKASYSSSSKISKKSKAKKSKEKSYIWKYLDHLEGFYYHRKEDHYARIPDLLSMTNESMPLIQSHFQSKILAQHLPRK